MTATTPTTLGRSHMNFTRTVHAATPVVTPSDVGVTQPSLVTVPGVELLEVGTEWVTSTGSFDFSMEDLVSCIASQDDPAVRTPIVKLGHIDSRFDGQPAIGRIENLRLTNNDQTLVGDLVAVPLWLAQVMFTAYPRRSIEANLSVNTRTGNKWDMVLTGVALLGEAYPAIDTLEDIQALWGANPPPMYPAEGFEEVAASSESSIRATRKIDDMNWRTKNVKTAADVQASTNLDTVRTAFYEMLDDSGTGEWWWIREVRVNPMTLIVDDDMGSLWEFPVEIDGSDTITFGEAAEVKVQYVAASGTPVAATQGGQIIAATHEGPEDSGRNPRPTPDDEATVPSDDPQANPPKENTPMLTDEALIALGLEPGASPEDISAAILAKPEAPEAEIDDEVEPTTDEKETGDNAVSIPEGMVLVDASTLEEMRSGIAASNALVERQAKTDRDSVLDGAVRAGKFPLARRGHYEAMLSADPVGTESLIMSLEPGLVPVAETGEQTSDVAAAADQTAYPTGWARTIEAGRRSSGDRVKVTQD